MVGFGGVVLVANRFRQFASDFLELLPLVLSEDDHESDAVAFGIQAAKCLAAPAVLVFVRPFLAARAPCLFHVVALVDGGVKRLPYLKQSGSD